MDATTVPTPPAPRQAQDESIRLVHGVTTELPDAGVEVQVLQGERAFPESWTEPWATLSLHKDGSRCGAECGCVSRESLTSIRCGETVTTDDWMWMTFQVPLVVGWRRTGPSDAETRLKDYIEFLKEDLDMEAGHLHLAEERGAALERKVARMRGSLRRSRKAAADAEHRFDIAYQVAFAGWSAAILIASLWISAVIG